MRSKHSVSEKLLSWPDLVLLVFFVAFLALALAGSLSPADGTSTVGAALAPTIAIACITISGNLLLDRIGKRSNL